MRALGRLLLIPCLAPLLTVLLLSAANRSPVLQLKILVWTSPALPIGAWTALAATAGTAFSGLAAVLMLPSRRRPRPSSPAQESFSDEAEKDRIQRSTAAAMPERDIRDPAPTVSVPFRVVQRSSRSRPVEAPATASSARMDDWGIDPDQDW